MTSEGCMMGVVWGGSCLTINSRPSASSQSNGALSQVLQASTNNINLRCSCGTAFQNTLRIHSAAWFFVIIWDFPGTAYTLGAFEIILFQTSQHCNLYLKNLLSLRESPCVFTNDDKKRRKQFPRGTINGHDCNAVSECTHRLGYSFDFCCAANRKCSLMMCFKVEPALVTVVNGCVL